MSEAEYIPMTEAEAIALVNRVLIAGVAVIDKALGPGAAKAAPCLLGDYLRVTVEIVNQERLNSGLQDGSAHGYIVGPDSGQEYEN